MDGIVVPRCTKGGGGGIVVTLDDRKITLGIHIGKVFCSVLNARLSEAMENKTLGETQGGSEGMEEQRRFFCGLSSIGQIRRSQGKKTWLAFPSVWSRVSHIMLKNFAFNAFSMSRKNHV